MLLPGELDFPVRLLLRTVDDLSDTVKKEVFGAKEEDVTVGSETVKELIYDESQVIPDIGLGVIVTKSRRGVMTYRAIVFTKIKMNQLSTEATTKGETITWQTQAMSGMIMRDDTTRHMWKREATFTGEGAAVAYITKLLDIPSVI